MNHTISNLFSLKLFIKLCIIILKIFSWNLIEFLFNWSHSCIAFIFTHKLNIQFIPLIKALPFFIVFYILTTLINLFFFKIFFKIFHLNFWISSTTICKEKEFSKMFIFNIFFKNIKNHINNWTKFSSALICLPNIFSSNWFINSTIIF